MTDFARLKSYQAFFTPRPIVRQGLRYVDRLLRRDPEVVVDPSAGSGVFGQVFSEIWPDSPSLGIEVRGEERPYLIPHYDEVRIGSFLDSLPPGPVDLIATNPPFREFPAFVKQGHRWLRGEGVLVLLGLSTWGQSARGAELFAEYCPVAQLRVGGRIGFRGPGVNPDTGKPWGADQRDYSWWVWVADADPLEWMGSQYWRTVQLPPLSAGDRTWQIRPGRDVDEGV